MNSAQKRWMQLAMRVIEEQEPEAFFQLIIDINKILWEKENRLLEMRADPERWRECQER